MRMEKKLRFIRIKLFVRKGRQFWEHSDGVFGNEKLAGKDKNEMYYSEALIQLRAQENAIIFVKSDHSMRPPSQLLSASSSNKNNGYLEHRYRGINKCKRCF